MPFVSSARVIHCIMASIGVSNTSYPPPLCSFADQTLTALQANSKLGQSTAFQKEVSDKLNQWQKHANSIPTLTNIHHSLSYFGRDKGMANLDKNNEMEVTLKVR